jgi:hypothetical protein
MKTVWTFGPPVVLGPKEEREPGVQECALVNTRTRAFIAIGPRDAIVEAIMLDGTENEDEVPVTSSMFDSDPNLVIAKCSSNVSADARVAACSEDNNRHRRVYTDWVLCDGVILTGEQWVALKTANGLQ